MGDPLLMMFGKVSRRKRLSVQLTHNTRSGQLACGSVVAEVGAMAVERPRADPVVLLQVLVAEVVRSTAMLHRLVLSNHQSGN